MTCPGSHSSQGQSWGAHVGSLAPELDYAIPILCLLLWIKKRLAPRGLVRGSYRQNFHVEKKKKSSLDGHTHTHTTPRKVSHASNLYLKKEFTSRERHLLFSSLSSPTHPIYQCYFKLHCCHCVTWRHHATK